MYAAHCLLEKTMPFRAVLRNDVKIYNLKNQSAAILMGNRRACAAQLQIQRRTMMVLNALVVI